MKTKMWTAKPRFVYDMDTMEHGAPSVTEHRLENAFFGLCKKLPEDMANRLRFNYPRRMYNSPERELGSIDKCIEVDGHCPCQEEFNRRHFAYMRAKVIKEGIERRKAQIANN